MEPGTARAARDAAGGRVRALGLRLGYRRAGRGAPLLYLHDAGGDTLGAPVFDELAGDFDVVQLHLPGYPPSDPPGPLADAAGIADVLHAFLEAIGWPSATVAGTSLGAWFALELALRYPERVTGLVVAGAAGLHLPEDYLFALFVGGMAAEGSQRLLASTLASRLAPGERNVADLPPAVAAAVAGPFVQNLAAAAACSWNPYTANPRLLAVLERLDCPTVVIHGEHDALIPLAHGRRLAEAIAGAHLEIVRGGGHLVPLDAPAAFAEAVRRVRPERR